MPYNGTTGTYTAPALPGSWNPATAGSTASPTDWNTLLADFVTAYTTAICKDGQTTPTANLPMGGFKHTGVGNATARDSYAAAGQVIGDVLSYAADTGTADAIALAPSPGITAYVVGQKFRGKKIASANATTTPTANINSLGAGTITKADGTALAAGDLPSACFFELTVTSTTPTFALTAGGKPSSGTVNSGTANQLAYYAGTGTAVSGTNALPNGTTGTTQAQASNDTKAATDAYVDRVAVQQVQKSVTGAVATGTTTIPNDDTIPQSTEGDQYMSVSITPKSATSTLRIDVVWIGANSTGAATTVALFQDTTANALAATPYSSPFADGIIIVGFTYFMTSGTTSATTFKVRAGPASAATVTFNGTAGGRKLGGVMPSSITVTEYFV